LEETKQYEVQIDAESGGFKGLPEDLEQQLKKSNFNTKQIKEHPAQVLEVLNFNFQRNGSGNGVFKKEDPL
jgi:P21-Rho-binding domain